MSLALAKPFYAEVGISNKTRLLLLKTQRIWPKLLWWEKNILKKSVHMAYRQGDRIKAEGLTHCFTTSWCLAP